MTSEGADSASPSLESRIAARLTGDGVLISGRMAQWIEQQVRMTADRRIRLRDNDPEAYENLTALHLAALRSDSGTDRAVAQRHSAESESWISTAEAAEAMNVTDRCVRGWCRSGRLTARRVGRTWLVNSAALNTMRTLEGNDYVA